MSEWIKCSERMPEPNTYVLAYYPDMQFDGWKILTGVCVAQHAHIPSEYQWLHSLHYDVNITHWMPLPEPPKETDNE